MSPKLWHKHCESYFDISFVPPNVWVKLDVMNFVGSIAFWSQSIESILQWSSWLDLRSAIYSHFERDQQNASIISSSISNKQS
jgi:hypothetical protein